jgi:hypothetical protein
MVRFPGEGENNEGKKKASFLDGLDHFFHPSHTSLLGITVYIHPANADNIISTRIWRFSIFSFTVYRYLFETASRMVRFFCYCSKWNSSWLG